MVPLIIVTTIAFLLLIAIDLVIEFHLIHLTPRDQYTATHKAPKDEKNKGKGFKLAFFVIYVNMCIVTWFLYLAYKDLEEEIEREEYGSQPEIVISHIT